MSENDENLRPQTQLVRAGLARSQFRETSEALYLNSGFVFENAAQAEAAFKGENDSYIYSRYGNPTVSVFEARLAVLEGADMCRATATGMAAVFSSIACQLRAGERVVASRALFGSCHFIVDQILPRWGIETVFVDGTNLDAWEAALAQPTKAWCFWKARPTPCWIWWTFRRWRKWPMRLVRAWMVSTMCFATPLYQKPLELGADIVVYSATKHIDGHGRCLGGAVLVRRRLHERALHSVLSAHRAVHEPVQCLGDGEVAGDPVPAGGGTSRTGCRWRLRTIWRATTKVRLRCGIRDWRAFPQRELAATPDDRATGRW